MLSVKIETYKVKYSFQNGLSVSLTMLVLLRCNGLLVDIMQYGLMAPFEIKIGEKSCENKT